MVFQKIGFDWRVWHKCEHDERKGHGDYTKEEKDYLPLSDCRLKHCAMGVSTYLIGFKPRRDMA